MTLRNTLSLASGVGGTHIALTELGIKVAGTTYNCEYDPYPALGAKTIHPEEVNLGDLYGWCEWKLKDIDVVSASLPCQPHSQQGQRKGLDSKNGSLIYEAMKIFAHYKPKYIFFEQVGGFTSSSDGEALRLTVEGFKELGYNVQHGLLNSAAFSAQSRPRYYIVCRRKDLPDFELNVLEQPAPNSDCITDIMEDGWETRIGNAKRGVETCSERPPTKDGTPRVFVDNQIKHVYDANNVGNMDSIKRVYCPSGKAPTQTTCCGGNHEAKILQPQGSWVKVTPIEMMRLQGWPEWVIIALKSSGLSKGRLKKLAGNGFQIRAVMYILDRLLLTEDK